MIAYISKHGAVQEFVERAAAETGTQLFDLSSDAAAARDAVGGLPSDGRIVVAAPIYAGSIPKPMLRFLESVREDLLSRRVAIVLSCLYQGEEARIQLAETVPPWLVGHAERQFMIGGRVIMNELKRPVRFLVRKILGHDTDVDTMAWDEVPLLAAWLRGES